MPVKNRGHNKHFSFSAEIGTSDMVQEHLLPSADVPVGQGRTKMQAIKKHLAASSNK